MRYVANMEERARQSASGVLASLAHDHAAFVQSLARQRTLLERRYYMVVPAEAKRAAALGRLAERDPHNARSPRRRPPSASSFRCDEVEHQLTRCDLQVRRLADLELAQLYLACWSPERARAQRFRQQLDDYTALAVRAAPRAGAAE